MDSEQPVVKKSKRRKIAVTLICLLAVAGIAVACNTGQPAASAACTAGAFTQAINQVSREDQTGMQLFSSNGFRCDEGFAAVQTASDIQPKSDVLSDIKPILMLFKSQDGQWQRLGIAKECALSTPASGSAVTNSEMPLSISDIVCR
jgi:hypothetical protein